MSHWIPDIAKSLEQLDRAQAIRKLRQLQSPQSSNIQIEDRSILNFSSNDYLGLANDKRLIVAAQAAAENYGVGAGASHLIVGHNEVHSKLEQLVAECTGHESAIVFSSGYAANMAVISTLLNKDDTIFQDKLNHASLIDAGRNCEASLYRYQHLNYDHLVDQLGNKKKGNVLIATDSVFSMDGDLADVEKLIEIAECHNALLFVDDAHGFGVLGKNGNGVLESINFEKKYHQIRRPIVMGTFGKALGVAGAFVAGPKIIIDYLIQRARSYIYTTAQPPMLSAVTIEAIKINHNEPERRQHVSHLADYFRAGVMSINASLENKLTAEEGIPIQPLIVGGNDAALKLSEQLYDAGIFAVAIRPPTVPATTSRIRFSFSANHSKEDVDQLLSILEHGLKKLALC